MLGQNYLAGLTGGFQAGQQIKQAKDQSTLRNIFETQDINDPTTQKQIMALDPRIGMALQNRAYQREQDTYQRGREVKADARADETFKMKADEYARGLSADEAARTAAKVEQGLMSAIPLVESGNLDGLNQLFTQYGIEPVTSVEQATAALGQYQTVLGALKSVRDLNAGPKPSEAEAEITRMMSTGMPRDIAIKIKEGIYKTVTDPTSREAVVIDLGSGRPVYRVGMGQQEAPAASQIPNTEPPLAPDATSSFGIEGIVKSGVNTIADTAGIGAPFEDVQTTVADFAALRESLINDIASGYARQPPSWLLQNIRDLTPSAGGFKGPAMHGLNCSR